MLRKAKSWHSNLSKTAKILLWSVTAVLFGAVISSADSSTSNNLRSLPSQDIKVEKKTLTENSEIPFTKSTVNDSGIEEGKTVIRTFGVNGIKTSTYEITYENGIEKDKKLIKEEVVKQPINEVSAIGTKVAYIPPPPSQRSSSCDPNYSGCVPIASDVDCSGGRGNGPAYVRGPITVIGSDIYDLDRDGNGIACE